MKGGPENPSRRNFLTGASALVATSLIGAEKVEARALTEEETLLAEALRAPIRALLGEAEALFAQFEVGEVREYARVIRNAMNGAYREESTLPARNLMNLFSTDAVEGHPTRVYSNADEVIRDMQRILLREASHITHKGLKLDAERLAERLKEARKKIIEARSGKPR